MSSDDRTNSFSAIDTTDIQRTSFQGELDRLNKGIRIAWVLNFLILALVFEAAFVVLFMSTSSTNEEIAHFLLMAAVPSVLISALSVFIITRKSADLILGSTGGELEEITEGRIKNLVDEMCIASGLPADKQPTVYVSHGSGIANAYAISNGHDTAVVVTEEIINMMDRNELQAIIGHEIGHIADGDCEAMTKLTALTSIVSIVSGIASRFTRSDGDSDSKNPIAYVVIIVSFIFLLIAPALSAVAKSYMSRKREARADATSVKLTRNPTALARALYVLKTNENVENEEDVERFVKRAGDVAFYLPSFSSALATHPPLDDRIRGLIAMGADPSRLSAPTMTASNRMMQSRAPQQLQQPTSQYQQNPAQPMMNPMDPMSMGLSPVPIPGMPDLMGADNGMQSANPQVNRQPQMNHTVNQMMPPYEGPVESQQQPLNNRGRQSLQMRAANRMARRP